jgi:general secretion pathway protein A
MSEWLLSPESAAAMLWELYSTSPYPGQLCARDNAARLSCVEEEAGTWDEIADIDRPLLVELVTPERFAAAVVVLGIEGRFAWLVSGERLARIDLAEIGPMWSGRYRYLWHSPEGFERPVAIGDRSPAVAAVAEFFARLDGQPQPLAGDLFTAPLKQRVILFQRTYGLEDDGVVGQQTLLQLNQALGIDPRASELRLDYELQAAPAGTVDDNDE